MLVHEARNVARQWLDGQRESIPGYRGAYLAGSICWLDDQQDMPGYSDIDLHVVIDTEQLTPKLGKIRYQEALLEISHESAELFSDPGTLLGNAAIGASVSRNQLLDDPTGTLAPIFKTVAEQFPERIHVVERLDALQQRIRTSMVDIDESAAFHDQAMWVFPASLTTHLILVAGLGNPTVRRRFVEVGAMLETYREPETLEILLGLIGCNRISANQARYHLDALVPIYDATSRITSSTSRFISDVSADARSISIDGTADFIDRGHHREAMFWIVATFARCLNVIQASDDQTVFPGVDRAFRKLMGDLGVTSVADIRARATAVIAALPQIRAVANRIVERNDEIVSPSQEH